jgi:hypothetical protein
VVGGLGGILVFAVALAWVVQAYFPDYPRALWFDVGGAALHALTLATVAVGSFRWGRTIGGRLGRPRGEPAYPVVPAGSASTPSPSDPPVNPSG